MKTNARRGMGSVYLRDKIYWIKYYRNGRPRRESSRSESKSEALNLLKVRLAETVTGSHLAVSPGKIRMDGLFDALLADYVRNEVKDVHIARLRINAHLRPAMGTVKAADLTTSHINNYIERRKRAGRSNATINRELALIRRAFKVGMKQNPPLVSRMPLIEELPETNVRTGFLSHEDYLRLLSELKRARMALVIGYHLGIRRGEILKLQWPMVDFDADVIRIPGTITKNGKPRTLPLYGGLREAMIAAKAERDEKYPKCPWVVSHNGRRVLSFKAEWATVTERVGLPNLLFHDLRRSAVRNMKRAGLSDKVAMDISGHTTRSMFDRYNITDEADIAAAGKAMERAHFEASTGTEQTSGNRGKKVVKY